MKKNILLLLLLCPLIIFPTNGQELGKVPMTAAIADESSYIPASVRDFLVTRMKSSISKGGMGATDDFCQFYMTCSYKTIEKHIVPGAPTKYFQTTEMNFFVVDAFAGKIFASASIETKGVGNSEEQANMASVRQFSPGNSTITEFIKNANDKIVTYYNEQYKNIITKAQSLAKVFQYEEALFQLSVVPEVCIGYQEVVNAAADIYQKYLDDKANKALAKAIAIWNAGQDATAAAEAGVYLAEIMPDTNCYPNAVKLSNEMKSQVKSDIDYYRKLEEEETAFERKMAEEEIAMKKSSIENKHREQMAYYNAWKEIGIAYGNNQKGIYYNRIVLDSLGNISNIPGITI